MNSFITVLITHVPLNKTYNIQLNLESKVQDLIDEFTQIQGFDNHDKKIFSFKGVTLQPKKQFKDYGIRKGDQIDFRTETDGG